MNRLDGKVAIVTGGATGIGEAICKKFAKEGAKVVVVGLPGDPVDTVVREIKGDGGDAIAFQKDISKTDNARECINATKEKFGKLDILVNNAGVFPEMNELQDFSEEAFEYMLDNNVKTTFLMSKFALPELQKSHGNIVSAGSESGILGLAKNTPYGGTKGWIHSFTEGLAVEQAKYGVRVNAVCPGVIDTAWTHKETGPFTKETEEMVKQATPLGRRGTPEEIANAYLFLASDEASYVTGSLFSVDGGITKAKGAVGEKARDGVSNEPEGDLNLKHKMEGHTQIRK